MRGRPHRRSTAAVLLSTAVAAVLASAGCAQPEYRFVASSERDLVVKVPYDWQTVPFKVVQAAEAKDNGSTPAALATGVWYADFDSASSPSAAHVRATEVNQPVLLMRSIPLTADQVAALDADALHDFFLPVSETGRAQRDAAAEQAGVKAPVFRLISDKPVSVGSSNGVHVVFGYVYQGREEQLFDEVTLFDTKRKRLQALLVHCTSSCFEQHRPQIETITDSLTVRKA